MGRVYALKGQYDRALAEGEQAINLAPNLSSAYFWYGVTLCEVRRPTEAIGVAEKAMRLDPHNRDLYQYNVGNADNILGRYPEAVSAFDAHLASFPNSLFARLQLAVAYTELGRDAEARAEVAEVLRISPRYSMEVFEQQITTPHDRFRTLFEADLRKAGLK